MICVSYRHPKPKPIVALPKVDRMIKVVYMQHNEITEGKLWILHLGESATRYAELKKKKGRELP